MTDQTPGRSIVFGRGPGADVVVDDDYCSPRHCRIYENGAAYFVEDLGSTNGTWVISPEQGRRKVNYRSILLPGDQVRIGRTTLPWKCS